MRFFYSFLLRAAEERLGNNIFPAVAAQAHAGFNSAMGSCF
jgi:hypothetical protein